MPVAITAGANAVPVAEFTLLLVLAVLRRLPHREAQLRGGEWQRAREETRVHARQLRGKVVGLVGLGAIGREVARRMRAFDAEVRYYDVRRLAASEERALGVRFQDLDPLLAEADIVSLHVPLLPSTRELLSRERIARLRPGAIVINTARGELVDEAALAEALESGRLAGAGARRLRRGAAPGRPPAAARDGRPAWCWRRTWRARSSTTSGTSPATCSRTSGACSTASPCRRGDLVDG